MERDGIDLLIDGEYLCADGTTLGGDDGIAVAYILALLDDNGKIKHPPIEALLTTDEEIGLCGAHALDASRLKGKRLINIDSEEEGVLTVSCAGAVRISCDLPVSYEETDTEICAKKVGVCGLLGGHSGVDIGKNHKNAAKILAEFLYELSGRIRIKISDFISGGRLNVIPPTAETVICIDRSQEEEFYRFLAEFNVWLKTSCAQTEPDALITAADVETPKECLDQDSSKSVISALLLVPNGISAISEDIPFLVLTSSNLGSVSIKDGNLKLGFMIRSNVDCGKDEVVRRIKCLIESMNGKIVTDGDYPAWEYRRTSPLRDVMVKVYEDMYGQKPQICALHAGLECGILSEKISGADMISIGPNMKNVHTPDERLEIKSVQRCWEYLLRVLESLKLPK